MTVQMTSSIYFNDPIPSQSVQVRIVIQEKQEISDETIDEES